jgi:hypothetical protein
MPAVGWLFGSLLFLLALLLIGYGLSGLRADLNRSERRRRLAHLRKLSASADRERKLRN